MVQFSYTSPTLWKWFPTLKKIMLDYFPLVEMFVLMRGTFPLEEILFRAKLREIFWMPACDLAISAGWVVIADSNPVVDRK
jgi:hypothetical protein